MFTQKSFLKTFLVSFLFLFTFHLTSQSILAQGDYGLERTADRSGLLIKFDDGVGADAGLAIITGKIIAAFLGLLGVMFLFFLLLGGFEWMSAGGNEEKIKHAKGMIINAVHGIIITMVSYALAGAIIDALTKSIESS
jgi:hypothetical protein